MKILLLHLVGIPHYAAEIANSLARMDHDVHILVAERNLEHKSIFHDDIEVSTVGLTSNIKILLRTVNPLTYYRIYRTIATIDPDVIHITQGFVWINPVLPFISKYPIVLTDHEPEETNDVTFYGRTRIYSWSKSHMRRNADRVVVHGEYLRDVLLSLGLPDEKIEVIKHGVYRHYTKLDAGESTESLPDNNVLFFGLIADYKGIDVLGDAIPEVHSQLPNVTFKLAGNGDITQYLDESVANADYVTIQEEYIPETDVGQLFRNASLVVLPYKSGSQSGVLTIAYQFGTPAVVTDVGSLPEAVDNGQTGFIVPPNDPDALAQAICDIFESESIQSDMVENIDEKVETELSWDVICEDLVEIYNRVQKTN
jgi:glycosyltransferase involved in cell wall biosynthesis